ncbi:hypothetical protein AOC33_01570 [Polynucleobacter cosmopolitanus]|uniref:Lipoprotein n=2 Tax=Polynucleobacter cosmopolitanus TaxID=351345 RepID=A0A229FV02_9BURK|nr:hypothetical protein AOC33_01570 [Polynucleobacter cosmopolitanus]
MQIKQIMLRNLFIILGLLLTVSACSPTLDWRTVRSDDLLYEALYPGKPSRAEKSVMFDGHKLTMTIEASKVENSLYAVGVINIPKDISQKFDANGFIKYLQTGMLSNLKNSPAPIEKTVTIKTAGQSSIDLSAKEFLIQGDGPDAKKRLLRFRIVQRQFPDGQIQIYQQSLLQTIGGEVPLEKLIQTDAHEMFFSGFKPY